jgi:hypothetical protein
MPDARETLAANIALKPITIPEAMAFLIDEGFDRDEARLFLTGALLQAKLLGGDQKGPNQFRELAATLQHPFSRGVVDADLKAVRRLSRGLAIPWESWSSWIGDGSVDWSHSEIARNFGDRIVIFTPVFRREDLLSLVPKFEPVREGENSTPTLKPASEKIIRNVLRSVYQPYPKGEAPNVNLVVHPVKQCLQMEAI